MVASRTSFLENSTMPSISRRDFLEGSAALAGTVCWSTVAGGAPPSEKVNVAVLGAGRGASLATRFATLPDSQLVAICEVDESRGQALAESIGKITGKKPPVVSDFRTLLDRQDVDALAIATPDHWHAPATIMACVAGKDVYVEKPASHNVVEGRLAVNAARKLKRIVQHGTNLRGALHYEEAWDLLRKGEIGKVLMVKAINNQRRGATNRFLRGSTTTCGSVRRRNVRSTATGFTAHGTGCGISAPATSATTASIRSISAAGRWG
jgi:hypothetical protein